MRQITSHSVGWIEISNTVKVTCAQSLLLSAQHDEVYDMHQHCLAILVQGGRSERDQALLLARAEIRYTPGNEPALPRRILNAYTRWDQWAPSPPLHTVLECRHGLRSRGTRFFALSRPPYAAVAEAPRTE